ncbi:hypothetical protein [Larkinella terrae]|uniref:Uncharacterized protein n=1 Tax=Larkinella terrae TaxID=2025311 RepID=A0A7K0EMP2_9BACT|nr:hypothetical protein [Larkinella terrae]MRS63110.1 hypothetical protein [Larkinella terrae]
METTNETGASTDKNEILKKYTRQPYPTLVKPAPNTEPDETDENEDGRYRALVQHMEKRGNAPRFRIIDRRGHIYGCGYAYLLGWFYTPPETLSIQTTTHVFTLTGKGLGKIEQSLLREKVKELREFHPGHDLEPEPDQPIITALTISSPFDKTAE